MLPLLVAASLAAPPMGWRGDGTGHAAGTPPTPPWTARWTATETAWSNASPVLVGDLVCTQAEPTDLVCLKAADGSLAWRVTHPVVEALPEAEQAEARALLAEADAVVAERKALQAAISDLARQARRHPEAADLATALEQAKARLTTITAILDRARYLRTPEDQEIMGYSTSTPATDGQRVYALYGNGVVAAHDDDGSLIWQRWLGRSVGQMRGYDRGHAASPVLAGDTLLVPWGNLHALDVRTGAERWSDGRPWRDYGSPAVTTVAGTTAAFTPDGRMLRVSDGAVLAEGLGDIYYVSPYAVGDRVFYVGGKASDHTSRVGSVEARAWRIVEDRGTLRTERLWATPVELKEVFYSAPVLFDGHLYSVDKSGVLRVFDADTGRLLSTTDHLDRLRGWTYPSPVISGGLLWLGSGKGQLLALRPGPSPEIAYELEIGGDTRATPLFVDGSVYVRRLDGLIRYD
jgi:outer membrane protein assembly factor BamB